MLGGGVHLRRRPVIHSTLFVFTGPIPLLIPKLRQSAQLSRSALFRAGAFVEKLKRRAQANRLEQEEEAEPLSPQVVIIYMHYIAYSLFIYIYMFTYTFIYIYVCV